MSRKPSVVFLGPLPPPYMGPTVATRILLGSSLGEEFDIDHLDTSDHRDLTRLAAVDVTNVALALRHYAALTGRLMRGRADLVYVPVSQTTIGFLRDSVFILIAKAFRRKVVCHLRGGNFDRWAAGATGLTRWYVRRILGMTQGMIVLGEGLRGMFRGYVADEKIFVVPNGADYDAAPSEHDGGGTLRLLYIGNLQSKKGIEDVVRAVAVLKEEGLFPLTLDVVGNWRDEKGKERCLRLCREKDLPVTFHGQAVGKEKMAFLSRAGVFVFTPRQREGHPWVIIEAMAAGLPVIATDQGAIAETVLDGENGFIVEAGIPEGIAEKIGLLGADPEMRKKMGEASRRLYLEKFREEKMVENMARVFRSIVRPSPVSSPHGGEEGGGTE